MNALTENLILQAAASLPDGRGVYQFLARNKNGACFYITAIKANEEVSNDTFKESLEDIRLEYITAGTILPSEDGINNKRVLIQLNAGEVSGFCSKEAHGFVSDRTHSVLESYRAFNIVAKLV